MLNRKTALFVAWFLFVFWCILSELSVPVQVIAWKDSSLKRPVMCWVGRKTHLTHSLSAQWVTL